VRDGTHLWAATSNSDRTSTGGGAAIGAHQWQKKAAKQQAK